jgi:hypothetical protein
MNLFKTHVYLSTPVFQIRCSERSCVTIRLGSQETKVLVRSRCWLEDGGGLPTRRVIYTQHKVSVVTMGTWPMGDSEGLWIVRISSHNTVCLGSPLFYFESIKWEIKRRIIYEYRCDERLKTKNEESTLLTDTGLVVKLEHLKTKTRLIEEKFASVRGECET